MIQNISNPRSASSERRRFVGFVDDMSAIIQVWFSNLENIMEIAA